MAKKKELMDYLDEFIECGKIRTESTLTGDYKANNKAYKKMDKILLIAKNSDDKELFYLKVLDMVVDDTITLITCCAHMLKLDVYSTIARKKLEYITKDKRFHPIFQSDAKMFLQEWDKGSIKPIA